MVRLITSKTAVAAVILGLTAAGLGGIAGAAAQATMPSGGAMPLPPSANDPPPKSTAPAAAKKPPRASAKKKTTVSDPYGGGGSGSTSYTDRIDTRPARGDLQLEDDPRVKPTFEGGRPGVGMRF